MEDVLLTKVLKMNVSALQFISQFAILKERLTTTDAFWDVLVLILRTTEFVEIELFD